MLTVDVRFIAFELTPGLKSGEYRIEDGATVLDLLALCEKECGASIPERNYEHLYPLYNSSPVRLETALTESGTLHVCRVVMGG